MSKRKKHHYYESGSEDDSSYSSSSDSSDQTSSSEDQRKRKRRRKSHTRDYKGKKKEKRAKTKHKKLKESHKKKKHKEKKKKRKASVADPPSTITDSSSIFGPQLPSTSSPTNQATSTPAEPVKRSLAPMTKEEYDKQQSVLRRVLDPETGRHRLVKGDGEIVEEIVSRDRHAAINKLATLSDGYSFQAGLRKL